MLNHFEAKAEEAKKDELPEWVSENNLSKPAYLEIIKKQDELMAYIERHKNLSDFKAKKTYHISARSIAIALDCAANSLTDEKKVSFAKDFNDFLKGVNKELLEAKNARVEKQSKKQSRGKHAATKEELVELATSTEDQLKELQKKNVIEQVETIFNQLDEPIRRKLQIRPSNVVKF
ncbi:MAG: hypothetical protein ACFHVJ_18710 [Aestuariibacter sp.]